MKSVPLPLSLKSLPFIFLVSVSIISLSNSIPDSEFGVNTSFNFKQALQEVKDELYQRVILASDDIMRLDIKLQMVDYLVESALSEVLDSNRYAHGRQDEDGDEGGTAEGQGQGNEQVINGVRRVIQNIFAGNLIGIIQESVSISSPGPVQTLFADVLGSLFGSKAVIGAGTHGLNLTQANGTQQGQQQQPHQVGVFPTLIGGAAGVINNPGGVLSSNAINTFSADPNHINTNANINNNANLNVNTNQVATNVNANANANIPNNANTNVVSGQNYAEEDENDDFYFN